MYNKKSSLLIILQILISFVLGVFGNKVSELFDLKPEYIIYLVAFLLFATILISLPKENLKSIRNIVFKNKVFIFPLFFLYGITIGIFIIKILDLLKISSAIGFVFYMNEEEFDKHNGFEFYVYSYELLAYLIVSFTIWLWKKRNLIGPIQLLGLIGASGGITTSILYFKPEFNHSFETFIGGLISCILIIGLFELMDKVSLHVKRSG